MPAVQSAFGNAKVAAELGGFHVFTHDRPGWHDRPMIAIVAAVRIVHRHKVLLAPPSTQTPLSRKAKLRAHLLFLRPYPLCNKVMENTMVLIPILACWQMNVSPLGIKDSSARRRCV